MASAVTEEQFSEIRIRKNNDECSLEESPDQDKYDINDPEQMFQQKSKYV